LSYKPFGDGLLSRREVPVNFHLCRAATVCVFEEPVMFIILWVVMGVLLGGCAGLLLIAGLHNSRESHEADARWSTLDYAPSNPQGER